MKKEHIEIKKFTGNNKKENMELAKSYMRSYNTLSEKYKSKEEMKCYTLGFFVNKLDKIAKDENSDVFVLMVNNQARGFVRYSPIPEYYKHKNNEGFAVDFDTDFERKIKFINNTQLNDNTVCVNQIYLDPAIQGNGLGTTLLKNTLHLMQKKGYNSVIIEYNVQNYRVKRFYAYSMGISKFAETKDLDQIIFDKKAGPVKYISNVEIGYNTIKGALNKLHKIENSRFGANNNFNLTLASQKSKDN